MRIPAVLVVSALAAAFAWSYGPAWILFGAFAVATFAFIGIRQAMRSRLAGTPDRDTGAIDPLTMAVLLTPADTGGAASHCGDGGSGGSGCDGGSSS